MSRTRYALVGAGNRATVYMDALTGPHREYAQLIVLVDPSPTRLAWHAQRLSEQFRLPPVAGYAPADFDQMLREHKPDALIVTAPDYLHAHYAIAAMNAGCDVICEKPVTIDG